VNDLDMEGYIRSLAADLDILTSLKPPKAPDFISMEDNCPLGPTSNIPYSVAKAMSTDGSIHLEVLTLEIRSFLRNRVNAHESQMIHQHVVPEHPESDAGDNKV